jgi:hypothetical protein
LGVICSQNKKEELRGDERSVRVFSILSFLAMGATCSDRDGRSGWRRGRFQPEIKSWATRNEEKRKGSEPDGTIITWIDWVSR